MMRKIKENKGFTLAELLIVVAIIAVLVAIAIPIFSSQLEKSREATDAANARAAYAELMVLALNGESVAADIDKGAYTIKKTSGTEGSFVYTATIPCKQTQDGWQNSSIDNIAGVSPLPSGVGATKTITVTYTQSSGAVAITAG